MLSLRTYHLDVHGGKTGYTMSHSGLGVVFQQVELNDTYAIAICISALDTMYDFVEFVIYFCQDLETQLANERQDKESKVNLFRIMSTLIVYILFDLVSLEFCHLFCLSYEFINVYLYV